MENFTYQIQYNDELTLRMISGNDSLGPMELNKLALEAVLAEIVMRAKEGAGEAKQKEDIWRWLCTQIGQALQRVIPEEEGQDPLDTLIHAVFRLKEIPTAEDAITPAYLLEHLLSYVHQQNEIESVLYIARMNDGTIASGWTDLAYTEAIGLLEVGKLQVIKEMWNEWEPQ